MKANIVLIGFMGAGKTAVGRQLSQRLNLKFADLDCLIEQKEKRQIAEIFSQEGEAYFRKIEKQMVKQVSQGQNQVIACGGGVVIEKENIENLKKAGALIYLRASPEVLFNRIKGQTHRPLLKVDDQRKKIDELLKFRAALYTQADYTIDTSNLSVEDVVSKILEIIK